MSDSLRPHELQHTRPPCPSPTPRVHSNSCLSNRWCHPAISSSVIPFSSCPQFLPASGSFPMSQLFAWGGQRTGVSALASFLPKKSQDWSPSEWTGWISLQSRGLSRVFSGTTVQKHQFFGTQLSSQSNSYIHTWPLEKPWPWLKCSNFILLHVAVQFSQHHLPRRLSFLHCILLLPLSKIRCPYMCGFISGPSILFHWSLFLFLCQYHTVLMCAKSLQSCPILCEPVDCSPRRLCPWDSPGKNTIVCCCALLKEIFLTQGLNAHLLCLLLYH